ncbi:MAG TPA: ABC transporter ATP-binding protein [Phycisphaerae bacterium]|jgi:phospholipid/cholesterol/gamma-HCH transport system ATP-binding protein|nr:ABC transporter ATP-binding protein [Phycisphaerae bacterium]
MHMRLVNVHKSFGSLVVLNGLSLDIHERESVVILGPSGTGKSVLLKHLVGLLKPDSGEVFFRDMRIDTLPERQLEPIREHFGFLFQMGALFDSMSVFENIAFPMREHRRYPEREVRDRVAQKLAMVGLDGTQSKMPGELSGGMKKRVALARAIALDPEVVLYDEPTTGLDPIRSDVINELILKLNDELHVTSVVVTHDMASAFKVGDRLVMLSEGKVIAEGKPDDFRHSTNEEVRRFVDGKASPDELAALERKRR